jgi:hypothetical protein
MERIERMERYWKKKKVGSSETGGVMEVGESDMKDVRRIRNGSTLDWYIRDCLKDILQRESRMASLR